MSLTHLWDSILQFLELGGEKFSLEKITDELIIKIDDIDYKSATRNNKSNLKKDEIELLTQMYEDQDSNPNSNFILSYIKID